MLLLFILFFGVIIAIFVVVSVSMAAYHTRTLPTQVVTQLLPPTGADLPRIPRNLAQIHASMDHVQFEYFSAALVIAMGEGHRFHSRVGGSGDHGTDTILKSLYGHFVIVQSKLYKTGNNVGPNFIRDFMGAMSIRDVPYGYFVTTSELTEQSLQTAMSSRRPIHVLDGRKIEALLHHRSREVALAYKDVLDAVPKDS